MSDHVREREDRVETPAVSQARATATAPLVSLSSAMGNAAMGRMLARMPADQMKVGLTVRVRKHNQFQGDETGEILEVKAGQAVVSLRGGDWGGVKVTLKPDDLEPDGGGSPAPAATGPTLPPEWVTWVGALDPPEKNLAEKIKPKAKEALAKVDEAKRTKFLKALSKQNAVATKEAGSGTPAAWRLDDFLNNDEARQVQLIGMIDGLLQMAGFDDRSWHTQKNPAGDPDIEKEGHVFGRHGTQLSDQWQFARATQDSDWRSRWESPELMLKAVEHEKTEMMKPDRMPDAHCALNAAGRKALKAGKHQTLGKVPATIDTILASPKARYSLMKAKVDIENGGDGSTKYGTTFSPDGATKKDCNHYSAFFSLSDKGAYELITAYPSP